MFISVKFNENYIYIDLTLSRFEPLGFLLWGHLKSMIYNQLPKTLDDLKANIGREIQKISKIILKSTILTFHKRRELIFSDENGHLEINNIL